MVDLTFSGFVPEIIEDDLDHESKSILTGFEIWRDALACWIDCVRNNPKLTYPEMIRTNNRLSLGLVFTNDLLIQKLNQDWRNKMMPTDVLSFPVLDNDIVLPSDQFVELGDIIVSVETALKQAKINNHSLLEELRWLVSHGLLHLLGWDHPSSSSLDKMLKMQEQLIKIKLGSHSQNRIAED
ncbi:Metal-dependent hydrolase YbeY [Prochlorococcus sp. MIT 0602]|nr:Metal-dependent hydrolase YbeY [Prochlorococcus sp. MIT 0602]